MGATVTDGYLASALPEPRIELLSMTDLRFLPQLLILARSVASRSPRATLRVLCMDEASLGFLSSRRLPGVSPMALDELENEDRELRAVRASRRWHEYCWSAVPAFCLSALTAARAPEVAIWLDADLKLLAGIDPLLTELSDSSVLLVPHRYFQLYPSAARAPYLRETYGSYNGGTLVVRGDETGVAALRLWRALTLEWCRDQPEPGRFGNQLHLEGFPDRWPDVRVATDHAVGLAPWNAGQHHLTGSAQAPLVDGRPVSFYHYQSLRVHRLPRRLRWVPRPPSYLKLAAPLVVRTKPWFRLTRAERRLLWRPYLNELAPAVCEVAAAEPRLLETMPVLRVADLAHDWWHKLRLNLDRRWLRRAAKALVPKALVDPVPKALVDFDQRSSDH